MSTLEMLKVEAAGEERSANVGGHFASSPAASPQGQVPKSNLNPGKSCAVKMESTPLQPSRRKNWRNMVAFWLLGVCNNYGYVVMLSAAHDVLSRHEQSDDAPAFANTTSNSTRECNPMSTGAILLADILPSLFVKMIAPFLPFYIHVRVILVVILSAIGFFLVAITSTPWLTILGVASTSLASGLGELSFLAYSHRFDQGTVTGWASGTGGAGIFGAGSYAGMTSLGLSPSTSLLIMEVVPVCLGVSFWVILLHPTRELICCEADVALDSGASNETNDQAGSGNNIVDMDNIEYVNRTPTLSKMFTRLGDIPPLMKFMVPLGLVYFFEYFANQGLFELLYYPDVQLNHKAQYRWFQFAYQIGVFFSRTSAYCIRFRMIWAMAVLQFLNVVLFLFESLYWFIPSFWILLAFVLWEGCLGGAAYVNTYHRITEEVPVEKKAFSLSITTLADAIGIGLAGALAIPVHNVICGLPAPKVLN